MRQMSGSLHVPPRDVAGPILQIYPRVAPIPRPPKRTTDVSIPILQTITIDSKVSKKCLDADPTDIFERYTNSEIPNICDRCPYSKVSSACKRWQASELPDDRGRCPDLSGAHKRYPGHKVLGRRSHLQTKVEATWSKRNTRWHPDNLRDPFAGQ